MHISDVTKERIRSTGSIPAVIPGGLTKILQPLDISVNKFFKTEMRKLWEAWMSDGEKSYTATGRMRRASYQIVCRYIIKVVFIVIQNLPDDIRKYNESMLTHL